MNMAQLEKKNKKEVLCTAIKNDFSHYTTTAYAIHHELLAQRTH